MSQNNNGGMTVQVEADVRVQDGVMQFKCPRTWRFAGEGEWRETATDWTSVDELMSEIASELEEESS